MAQKIIEDLCLNNLKNSTDWHEKPLKISSINIFYLIKKNLCDICFSSPQYLYFLSVLLHDFFCVFASNI